MKSLINHITQWLKDPSRFFNGLLLYFSPLLPDKFYLSCMVRVHCGYWPNWKSPRTFSEKLQWLKVYNRDPKYTTIVDKFAVKDYVARTIGKQYVIPTLGVWDKPEDIDWEALPDCFVLKTTHGGGSTGVLICKNKKSFDRQEAIDHLNKSLKQDLYCKLREWPYKNVPRRIIAEQYIEPAPGDEDLPDYKWYCFNGEPKYCQVITNRTIDERIDFFDTDWNHQSFIGILPLKNSNLRNSIVFPKRPLDLELQIKIARKLSHDYPFSRIDLYSISNKTYFGEITFFPASGLGVFFPKEYNELLGQMLNLPSKILDNKD